MTPRADPVSFSTQMKTPYPARALLALVPALAVAACEDDIQVQTLLPIMVVEPLDVQFEAVPVGTVATKQVLIKNDGEGNLLDLTVSAGARVSEVITFSLDRSAVPPNGVAVLTVEFAPVELTAESAVLVAHAAGLDPQEITVSGTGVATTLAVDPTSLAFGNVVVGSSKTLPIRLTNTSALEASIEYLDGLNVKLCTTGGNDDSSFCLASRDRPIGPDSRFTLPGGASTQIDVQYRPSVAGTRDRASFGLRTCPIGGACELEIQLDGSGIESGFRCTPPALDFGFINPGSCQTKAVSCENIANDPVTVLGWALGQTPVPSSADFTLEGPAVGVLAQGDSIEIDATYCPTALGDDRGTIEIETDNRDPRLRYFVVNLLGTGGGPDIAVVPEQLNFGLVSLIAPSRRTLLIQNVGYGPLSINSIVPDAAGSGAFTVSEMSGSLAPGESLPVTVTFQPVAEGPITSELVITSDDQDEQQIRVPLLGEGINLPPCTFEVAPAQLAFGVVERSRTLSRAFEIRNTGTNDCLVTGVQLLAGSDQEFSLPDGDVQSLIIPAGSATTVRVEYSPTATGDNTGTVEFSISSPRSPYNEVALSGTGADATLLIVPNDLDFGTIGVGCAARARTVTIYNTGATAAQLTAIGLAAPANPAFTVSAVPALPIDLAPGASTSFDVGFRADAISSYAAAVEITGSFGGQAVTYIVSLTGRGDVDATQIDNFEQLGRPKVDILFVVDSSGSMFEEQQALGQNFASFIQFAEAQRLEYQIAVTDTDVDSGGPAGRFLPLNSPNRIVTPQTQPSPADVFLTNVNVGTIGSAFEQGLEASYLALSSPNIFQDNAGFLRQDAVLSVIYVSDEEDQSPNTVDFYANFLLSIKGFRNTNLFTASSIVGDAPAGCSTAFDAGLRYIEVANRTGGIFQSICATDWSRSLEELSTTAFGFKSRFFLANQPVITTIRVFIDGVELPGQDAGGTVNWSYDYGTNSVNFSPFATPEPGAEIRVEYTVECL